MVSQEKRTSNNEYQRQWAQCDLSVLTVVYQQRALSLDHLPRYLALFEEKWSDSQTTNRKSAIHNLVEHLQHAGLIHQHQFGRNTPTWIWLSKKGFQALGISSVWKHPKRSMLPTLHAANTIRLLLTEHDPQIVWMSQQQLRSTGTIQRSYPTAEVHTTTGECIAIHVILRLTGTEEQIAARMSQQLQRETSTGEPYYTALWYYAPTEVAKRLRAARTRIAETAQKEMARNVCIFSYPLLPRQLLYRNHRAPIHALAWSPDGKWLASAGEDALQVWDATTGQERFHHSVLACPSFAGWSCSGSWLALGDEDGRISFWDESTGTLHMVTVDHTNRITGLEWSPLHDTVLASCSANGTLRRFDLRRNTQQWGIQFQGVETLAWSPDGTRLAVGGNDTCVRLFNATTGWHIQTYKKHRLAVRTVAWSPDSQLLASASDDPTILIWDATSGKKRRTIRSGFESVTTLAWSPDGTRLACTGKSSSLQVWNVHTGRLVQTYADHADSVHSIAWSPDSKLLASASSDGTVHLFTALGGSHEKRQPKLSPRN